MEVYRSTINSYDDDMSIGSSNKAGEERDENSSVKIKIALVLDVTESQKQRMLDYIAEEMLPMIKNDFENRLELCICQASSFHKTKEGYRCNTCGRPHSDLM